MEAEMGTERDQVSEDLIEERAQLRARLTEAEQELAELPALRAAKAELEAIRSSPSWRITAPLRRAKGLLQRELLPNLRLAIKRGMFSLAERFRD
ncbi:MAG: hypothetical protein EXQ70_09180 [Solirubrobacterales bacterium]|nr:hypothetical protein [Solirubrobacterales bacterium]